MDEKIIKALSFGEHIAIKQIEVEDLYEMEKCFEAAVKDFNNATEEQINNDEYYQYFCGWCDKYLTQEFCDEVLGK